MPRKTPLAQDPRPHAALPASMRPRPDAAENLADSLSTCSHYIASMRPRPDAAENNDLSYHVSRLQALASMRPRPDAAENVRPIVRL